MTRIMCYDSSILSTFNSNHTLERLCSDVHTPLPEDLRSLLWINEENYPSQAARLKIIKTHLSEHEINMQPFMDMSLSIRPHAIAWMAKDDSQIYQFLRAMPSLPTQVGSKKRPYGLVEQGVWLPTNHQKWEYEWSLITCYGWATQASRGSGMWWSGVYHAWIKGDERLSRRRIT